MLAIRVYFEIIEWKTIICDLVLLVARVALIGARVPLFSTLIDELISEAANLNGSNAAKHSTPAAFVVQNSH